MIKKIFLCNILSIHKWDSPAQRDEKPQPLDGADEKEFLTAFYNHCEMKCKRCGKVSELSLNFKKSLGL